MVKELQKVDLDKLQGGLNNMDKRAIILEGLRQDLDIGVNENARNFLQNNIDRQKYDSIEKQANKSGYTFSSFEIYKLPGGSKVHGNITIVNKSDNKLLPHIMSERTGDGIKFYIVPSFMGELNSNGARLMSKYLSEAADLVDILNKTRWESFMTKDYPD